MPTHSPASGWRFRLHELIFEADTPTGKVLDVALLVAIILSVLAAVVILGSLMYLIEGEEHGFTSIPIAIYWAIVTMTTVGYGDIAPQTVFGKAVASAVMVIGYAIIAVPTGIVTVELANVYKDGVSTQVCPDCAAEGHAADAVFCKYCGMRLNPPSVD